MIEPVEAKLADVPLYSYLPKAHLDPDFVTNHIAEVLEEQGFEGDAWAAAGRIEAKCREVHER